MTNLWLVLIILDLLVVNHGAWATTDDISIVFMGENNGTRHEPSHPRRMKQSTKTASLKDSGSTEGSTEGLASKNSSMNPSRPTSKTPSRTTADGTFDDLIVSSQQLTSTSLSLSLSSQSTSSISSLDTSASLNALTSGLSYTLSATVTSIYPIQELWFIVRRPGSRRFRKSYRALQDSATDPNLYYVNLVDLTAGEYRWSLKALVTVGSRTRIDASPAEFTFEIFEAPSAEPSSSPSLSPSEFTETETAMTPPPAAPTVTPAEQKSATTSPPITPPTSAPTQYSASTTIRYGLQDDCKRVDTSKFNICLDLKSESGKYETWMDAFALARDRWQEIITDDGDSPMDIRPWFPRANIATELPTVIDDLYVSCSAVKIDGPGRILGMAGPAVIKSSNGNIRPVGGIMKFDMDDIKGLDDEEWKAVILHELGHVLGIGTLFSYNGLHSGRASSDRYSGTYAQAEWETLCPGGRLPIETDGSVGTAGGHWDEECLRGELMTGYLSSDAMQLSRITIASLRDMGYGVNMTAADTYSKDDLGNCGKYCPGQRRNLREPSFDRRREIVSSEGHREILAAAVQEFQRQRRDAPDHLPEGMTYMAAETLSVYIRDIDGLVKEESVTYAEIQEHIAPRKTNIFDHRD